MAAAKRAVHGGRVRAPTVLLWAWILLMGLGGATPQRAQAQAMLMLLVGDKIVTKNFQPGISASFVGTGFWGISNKMRLSWSLGIYGEIRLTRSLTLQPELMLKNPNGARGLSPSVPGYPFVPPEGEPTLDTLITQGEDTRELRAVALPVILKWVVGPIGLGLGPQLNVLTNASDTVKKKISGQTYELSQGIRKELTPYDIGVVGSVEYAFSKGEHMRSFRVRVKSVLGLVDTVKDNPQKAIRNWSVSFGVDIPIGKYKPNDHKPEPEQEQSQPGRPESPSSEPENTMALAVSSQPLAALRQGPHAAESAQYGE
ncbi:MAG: hypothetical protein QM778_05030 [Myxococcales bacterium]